MSLTRMFPVQSDRMSVMWTLMPTRDAVVLEYGPAGTTHFGNGMYASFGIDLNNAIFTTHISEDDVVMGDVSRLENAILEIDAAYSPRVIFVVGSAAIAVIGTDVKGVCTYMQEKVNARLITFDDGGFRGDYTYGLRAVYPLLVKELVLPADETEDDTYLILGASLGAYRTRSDVWEIQELMREAFGMRCRWVMGMEADIKDMEEAGKAAFSIVLRTEALEAAALLEEKAHVPCLYGAPYGYEGTLQWLTQIAKMLHREISPVLVSRLKEKMRRNGLPMGGPMGSTDTKEPVAVLQGDYDLLTGLRTALSEMQITVSDMLCSHSMKAIENAEPEVRQIEKEKERIAFLRTLHDCWLLGSIEMEEVCAPDNYFTCVSAPFAGKVQLATHLPFMGEKGMDFLMEESEAYYRKAGI